MYRIKRKWMLLPAGLLLLGAAALAGLSWQAGASGPDAGG